MSVSNIFVIYIVLPSFSQATSSAYLLTERDSVSWLVRRYSAIRKGF